MSTYTPFKVTFCFLNETWRFIYLYVVLISMKLLTLRPYCFLLELETRLSHNYNQMFKAPLEGLSSL